ncbi:hypothetical protein DES46_11427 [Caldimonas thermodepolymerans]|jgi:hypothetical protein|uniref:Uncharacterized protein n=3 Tax=Caldimonas thermodepolymerans TaxID=215580 RepID=A0AA46DAE8_9BURK|nr:hypothetical protein DES46_11427 [Caldimonas thermodepolymerans]TCP03148.1 hypothetical protein EV676_11427 [Caldimonas thermodepolymerans]
MRLAAACPSGYAGAFRGVDPGAFAMSEHTPSPAPRPQPDPAMLERAERVNNDLMKFVRQVRTATGPVRVKLQHDMRERLEAERAALLGGGVIPEPLRHYAVTFTEVQWLLDVWIEATERNGDDQEFRRDFIDVATRMLGELEVLRQPDPALHPPGRKPSWWSAITRGLRPEEAREGHRHPGDPDLIV